MSNQDSVRHTTVKEPAGLIMAQHTGLIQEFRISVIAVLDVGQILDENGQPELIREKPTVNLKKQREILSLYLRNLRSETGIWTHSFVLILTFKAQNIQKKSAEFYQLNASQNFDQPCPKLMQRN